MGRMIRQVDRIATRGEDGREVMVDVFQEFTESQALGREAEWLPGLKQFSVSGRLVTLLEDGAYQIVETGELLEPR